MPWRWTKYTYHLTWEISLASKSARMVEETSQGDLVLRIDQKRLPVFAEALKDLRMSKSRKMLSYIGIKSDEPTVDKLESSDLRKDDGR